MSESTKTGTQNAQSISVATGVRLVEEYVDALSDACIMRAKANECDKRAKAAWTAIRAFYGYNPGSDVPDDECPNKATTLPQITRVLPKGPYVIPSGFNRSSVRTVDMPKAVRSLSI